METKTTESGDKGGGSIAHESGAALIEREMPDTWLDWLAICGEPDECAEKIQALLDAGASSVGLSFIPADTTQDQLRLTTSEILPKIT